ncbi:MAG: hypothetical protein OEZ09_12170 [Betaproteobacteria bacterium]|nr:hypothetical protein [Betaproteobacteria bacterium]MDH5579201.1 hypothetical protein [Betaproteobacteria bacterium]
MTALFIVRAVVDPSVRDAFDRWYQEEHLPDALKAFKAKRAWRGWSDMDASVHYAFYEFDDVTRARAVPGSTAIKALIAEFDRAWGDKVKRTREILEVQQTL